MNVCLGGTFFPFHKGHKTLIKKACDVAGRNGTVLIGLTSDKVAQHKGINATYDQRKHTIEQFLSEKAVSPSVIIQSIYDSYGPSIDGDFDAIVVSPETKPIAEEINKKRAAKQKKPLQIIVIPFVLADDHQPINSTRIRRKEIDENGQVLHQE